MTADIPIKESAVLGDRMRDSGRLASFLILLVLIGGYYAFNHETAWQRALLLPVMFLVTFPLMSVFIHPMMFAMMKHLVALLDSGKDWSKLPKEEELRVLKNITDAPWGLAANNVIIWAALGPLFMWVSELLTPGVRHSYVDLALGLAPAWPAVFMISLLRCELELRPYLARARSQMKSKDLHLPLALSVHQRLMIASVLIGPYSILSFALLTYKQLALSTSVQQALSHFWSLQFFFVLVSGLLALCLAGYFLRVVKQPLDGIQAALTGSVSNAPETFDEFGVIHQLLLERKALEDAKQEFFAVVSHELRSPLMAIESFLRLLADGVYGDVPQRVQKKAGTAVSNADRLLRLVNDILDAEKLQSGKFECIFQDSNSHEIVDRAVKAVQDFAEAQGVPIEVDACNEEVVCDEERIVQVMINFLTNAVKNAAGKPVVISAKQHQNTIEFGVRDHGAGIPVELQQEVFEKFRKLRSKEGEKVKGTGLGLPIAKALVEQHGGEIGVQSVVGEGSYFFARIPVRQEKPLFHALTTRE
jgi:signal transduction histidine kinase